MGVSNTDVGVSNPRVSVCHPTVRVSNTGISEQVESLHLSARFVFADKDDDKSNS